MVAVEADPVLAAAADKRFAVEIAAGKLTLLNIGLGERNATDEFWINETKSHFNSFDRESCASLGDPQHAITIQCRRLDHVLSEFGIPYYLKIDIEGHDIVCCDQIAANNKLKYISVEMSRMELIHKLRDLGYDRFKLVTQTDLRPLALAEPPPGVQFIRSVYRLANYRKDNRALALRLVRAGAAQVVKTADRFGLAPWGVTTLQSRRLPEWRFIEGCSGTFGEDLPGTWLTGQEVALLWLRELKAYEKMGREFWCDLHATSSTD